ncbi:hypothetical protein HK405_012003, partial [Cladochytrium tenue]
MLARDDDSGGSDGGMPDHHHHNSHRLPHQNHTDYHDHRQLHNGDIRDGGGGSFEDGLRTLHKQQQHQQHGSAGDGWTVITTRRSQRQQRHPAPPPPQLPTTLASRPATTLQPPPPQLPPPAPPFSASAPPPGLARMAATSAPVHRLPLPPTLPQQQHQQQQQQYAPQQAVQDGFAVDMVAGSQDVVARRQQQQQLAEALPVYHLHAYAADAQQGRPPPPPSPTRQHQQQQQHHQHHQGHDHPLPHHRHPQHAARPSDATVVDAAPRFRGLPPPPGLPLGSHSPVTSLSAEGGLDRLATVRRFAEQKHAITAPPVGAGSSSGSQAYRLGELAGPAAAADSRKMTYSAALRAAPAPSLAAAAAAAPPRTPAPPLPAAVAPVPSSAPSFGGPPTPVAAPRPVVPSPSPLPPPLFGDIVPAGYPVARMAKYAEMITTHPHRYVMCSMQHPGERSCEEWLAAEFTREAARAVALYAPLNAVMAVIFRGPAAIVRRPLRFAGGLLRSTARSALFLTCYCTAANYLPCCARRWIGRDYMWMYYVNGLVSGAMVLIEAPGRRLELGMYCLPRAIESLWNCGVVDG